MNRIITTILAFAVAGVCASTPAPYTARATIDTPKQVTRVAAHVKHKRRKSTMPRKPRPKWMQFVATAYSPYDGGGQGTITKSGKRVVQGETIAVDTRVIPLGSTVEVKFADGYTHTYIAEDTGGAIRGSHIDIFKWSRQQCLIFGRQRVLLRVLHYGR